MSKEQKYQLCGDATIEVKKQIKDSYDYHQQQCRINQEIMPIIAKHHNIIIDYIENELLERLDMTMEDLE